MGFYRLFLAILVAISHAGISVYGFNPGVVAVISFFILSGYVMTMLIDKYYKKRSAIYSFYLDRIARLFPQFIFYSILSTLCIYTLKVETPHTNQLTFPKLLLNFLMLPQGFYMYWADGALLIPQSWSLGLELTFYIIFPWVLIYCFNRQIYFLAFFSFLIFLLAYLGNLNTNNFGYRLLPGTLFMFLVGWSFSKNDVHSKKFRFVILFLASVLLLGVFLVNSWYRKHYNKEVLLGLIAGIVIIKYLCNLKFSKLDEFLGNLSYGVFLNHFIVIWIMQKFLLIKTFDFLHITLLLLTSSVMALASFLYIERPALRWRQSIRHKAIKTNSGIGL
jgi:peptidoglycan/LPS O-acetylase OafA/YrhL